MSVCVNWKTCVNISSRVLIGSAIYLTQFSCWPGEPRKYAHLGTYEVTAGKWILCEVGKWQLQAKTAESVFYRVSPWDDFIAFCYYMLLHNMN